MKLKQKKVTKKAFKLLTGVVIGSAVGSILGMSLAPKKGSESRQYLKKQSKSLMNVFQKKKKLPLWKRCIVKLLKPKSKR